MQNRANLLRWLTTNTFLISDPLQKITLKMARYFLLQDCWSLKKDNKLILTSCLKMFFKSINRTPGSFRPKSTPTSDGWHLYQYSGWISQFWREIVYNLKPLPSIRNGWLNRPLKLQWQQCWTTKPCSQLCSRSARSPKAKVKKKKGPMVVVVGNVKGQSTSDRAGRVAARTGSQGTAAVCTSTYKL